jgi:hypothetical protein
MRNFINIIILFVGLVLVAQSTYARHDYPAAEKKKVETSYNTLGDAGSKIKIDNNLYFIYDYDHKPAMGVVIVKIQIFNKSGKKVTSLAITGASGMPEMRGAHDSDEVAFKKNKKGDYLMPVNVAMPGTWGVKLKFMKEKKIIFTGKIRFNV